MVDLYAIAYDNGYQGFAYAKTMSGIEVGEEVITEFDLGTKGRVLLAFEEELEDKAICFLVLDEGLGAASRQGEANRRILRELLPPFAPILHQGDVRRTPPTHSALKVVWHHAFEGFAQPFVFHFHCV